MRLWHKDLIPVLPRQQLLGQWRECCLIYKMLCEKGTPNHILVNYVTEYPIQHFFAYTGLVLREFDIRGYSIRVNDLYEQAKNYTNGLMTIRIINCPVKREEIFEYHHDDIYLRECLYNLEEKYRAGEIQCEEWDYIYESFKDFTPLLF